MKAGTVIEVKECYASDQFGNGATGQVITVTKETAAHYQGLLDIGFVSIVSEPKEEAKKKSIRGVD